MKIDGVRPPASGQAIRVQGEHGPIAIFNVADQLYALDARCPHAGGPMEQGRLEGTVVTCPWHGSQFELGSGAIRRGPALKPLRAYRVRAEGDGLVVDAL
jgi:nitrite reductase/ring-hydroxylating ferredoxin subunit